MLISNIAKYIKGWFIGNFQPALIKTEAFEVCVWKHAAGERPSPHYHKIAREMTMVVSGHVRINGTDFIDGDIFVIEPNEVAYPEILEDTTVVVIKIPSVKGDKYLV